MSVVSHSAPDTRSPKDLQIAHVLFMDLVGYSKLPMNEQTRYLGELQELVRSAPDFQRAEASGDLVRLPTGDGMALVFFRDPMAPIRCAMDISRALRSHPHLQMRMGIHSGAVYRVQDINSNVNVAGSGINMAQRVMDAGDAGHILLSSTVAEVLGQLGEWASAIHDLGHCEVKHGVRLHLFSLHTATVGNPEMPEKLRTRPTVSALLYDLHAKPDEQRAREIELHYQLVAAGEGARQVVQCLAVAMEIQASAAVRRNAGLAKLAFDPGALSGALAEIAKGRTFATVDPAGEAPEEMDVPWSIGAMLNRSLEAAAERAQTTQRMLDSVVGSTRQALPREVQENTWRADEAIRAGMRATGRERQTHYQDAMAYLRRVVDSRAGRRDYVAWFQLGWLAWKATGRLHDAEEALNRSVRLSSVTRDLFYVEGQRHLAYVRYLRGNLVAAYRTMAETIQAWFDPDALLDAARYAALTGRRSEALDWISQCIERSPISIITVLGEADFVSLADEVQVTVGRMVSRQRYQARAVAAAWADVVQSVGAWEEQAGHTVALPRHLNAEAANAAVALAEDADYLTALEIEHYGSRARQPAVTRAQRELAEELGRRAEALAALKAALDRALLEAGWVGSDEVRKKELAAAQAEREYKALDDSTPTVEENASTGCAIMVGAAVLLAVLAAVSGSYPMEVVRTPLGAVLTLLALGGWAIFPAIRWMRYWIALDAAGKRAAAARRAAEQAQARIIAETAPEVAERIHALEEQVRQAETSRASCEKALALAAHQARA